MLTLNQKQESTIYYNNNDPSNIQVFAMAYDLNGLYNKFLN